jgi:hypothetical protein
MGYKYTMRPSNQKFTIFILYCIYIFRASLSKILLYFLSLKRYLFKHRKVSTFIKENLLQVLAISHFDLPSISISYQPPSLGRMDEIARIN